MEVEAKGVSSTSRASPKLLLSYIFRFVAVILTLIATIVMGVAKQTEPVEGYDSSGDYLTVEQTVKSTYNSSFVYFIVVNAIAVVYSSMSLAMSLASRTNYGNIKVPIAMADVVMVVLLFSGNGAAAGIELVAQKGNYRFGWGKFCYVAHKFCNHLTASIVLSTVAAAAYVVLVMLAIAARKV